ncbi:MAG: ABC transporter permease [Myxococcota bacterium]|nr:ABC transporter permease [Myxococcota bacterium]
MKRVLLGLPVPITIVILWSYAVGHHWLTLIPSPLEVAKEMADFTVGGVRDDSYSGSFVRHLMASTGRVLAGFAAATAIAVPLGILLGRGRRTAAMMEPTLGVLRPIPVTAWVPLILIMFGLGTRSAIILIFIGAFFPILINTTLGVKGVPPRLIEAGSMLGTSQGEMLYKIILPAALPSIFTGMRIALGLAWVVLVVGETVGVATGLGSVITEAREVSRTEVILTGMVFIGLAGLASDKLLTALIRVLLGNRPVIVS